MDVSEAIFPPLEGKGEPGVVKSEEVENRRLEVMHPDFPILNLAPQLVRFPMNVTRFHPSSCHPNGETVRVVISAEELRPIAFFIHRRPAEFSGPNHQGVFE